MVYEAAKKTGGGHPVSQSSTARQPRVPGVHWSDWSDRDESSPELKAGFNSGLIGIRVEQSWNN